MISSDELQHRFTKLQPLIRKAGQHVTHMRKMNQATVTYKSDGSPVTRADEWANEFLKHEISTLFPEDVIIGEEDERKEYPAGSKLVWYLDPIDGTSSFVKGGSDYYVLAGLSCEGQPVLGLHYHPKTDRLIYGWTGHGAKSITGDTSPEPLEAKMPAWSQESRIFIKSYIAELREQVKGLGITRARYLPGMVDMVGPLFGKSEGFVSYRTTAYWDLVAPAAIMAAAGFQHSGTPPNGQAPLLFNDGKWTTTFYYCLPPNTPDTFIASLYEIRQTFETEER
ncbi:3'(2'),5'-bisphosphate nucleotidase CysQ family protein [Cyclonatronum proteinivorum]|uniref:3'(2'),5'-bisphosphate nucleotidase CysQ family protein n=1 Tax=Cyclonatronum proteinivorum TaxID=1457365 RepID=UPI000E0F0C20|nr:inositol monophosphatase family protein [Cyclonatronum proteinivorum]